MNVSDYKFQVRNAFWQLADQLWPRRKPLFKSKRSEPQSIKFAIWPNKETFDLEQVASTGSNDGFEEGLGICIYCVERNFAD